MIISIRHRIKFIIKVINERNIYDLLTLKNNKNNGTKLFNPARILQRSNHHY